MPPLSQIPMDGSRWPVSLPARESLRQIFAYFPFYAPDPFNNEQSNNHYDTATVVVFLFCSLLILGIFMYFVLCVCKWGQTVRRVHRQHLDNHERSMDHARIVSDHQRRVRELAESRTGGNTTENSEQSVAALEHREQNEHGFLSFYFPVVSYHSNLKKEMKSLQNGLPDVSETEFMESEDVCPICLENYQDGLTPTVSRDSNSSLKEQAASSQVRVLPCGHFYHKECIDPWFFTISSICPFCKGNFEFLIHASLNQGAFPLDTFPDIAFGTGPGDVNSRIVSISNPRRDSREEQPANLPRTPPSSPEPAMLVLEEAFPTRKWKTYLNSFRNKFKCKQRQMRPN